MICGFVRSAVMLLVCVAAATDEHRCFDRTVTVSDRKGPCTSGDVRPSWSNDCSVVCGVSAAARPACLAVCWCRGCRSVASEGFSCESELLDKMVLRTNVSSASFTLSLRTSLIGQRPDQGTLVRDGSLCVRA